MRISDMFLVSDLDGTILPHNGIISQRNKDAIKRFRGLGGTFTIATGRSPLHAVEYAKELGIRSVFIAGNGSRLYDMKTSRTIWAQCIKQEAGYLFKDLINDFPEVGIILVDVNQQFYVFNENEVIAKYKETGFLNNAESVTGYMLPENCCSGWLEGEAENIREVYRWFLQRGDKNIAIVPSGIANMDILPSGITKGASLEKLADVYGKSLQNTIAIGDYNNDIDMLLKAQLGAAVANALPEVKSASQLTVASCEDDGLAELIDYLILTADAD